MSLLQFLFESVLGSPTWSWLGTINSWSIFPGGVSQAASAAAQPVQGGGVGANNSKSTICVSFKL